MKGLEIGDPESIEERDKGRIDAWRVELETKLQDKAFMVLCPDGCEGGTKFGNCKGPNVGKLFHLGIIWNCSNRHGTCDCCGQEMADIDIPHSDFEGDSIGYIREDERKPFNPDLITGFE